MTPDLAFLASVRGVLDQLRAERAVRYAALDVLAAQARIIERQRERIQALHAERERYARGLFGRTAADE